MFESIFQIRDIIQEFCVDFISNPYFCYTEHGLHALFLSRVLERIPSDCRYFPWDKQQVCVAQCEYPTAGKLGKPRRQNWDFAIIDTPPHSIAKGKQPSYDYLKLNTVVEFGLNEEIEHLADDIGRLCHSEANVMHRYAVHLYRLSTPGRQFSGRDWSSNSGQMASKTEICKISTNKQVEIYYGVNDITGTYPKCLSIIRDGQIVDVPLFCK